MSQDFDKMSKDELLAANEELMQRRAMALDEIETEQMALQDALDKKIVEERVVGDVSEMSQKERDTLMHVLQTAPPPGSTETDEAAEEMVIAEGDVAVVDLGGGE